MKDLLTILSSDPGYVSYGYSVVQFAKAKNRLKFRIIENGMCRDTVSNLKDGKTLRNQLNAYNAFITNLIDQHSVDGLCGERFMTRGINGPSVEMVNFMLGVMITSANLPVKLWPAVVWKNACRRKGVDLKHWYKYCKATPHQLDATLIGIYTGYMAYGYKDFGNLNLEKLMPTICERVEETTDEKLVNRKMRK